MKFFNWFKKKKSAPPKGTKVRTVFIYKTAECYFVANDIINLLKRTKGPQELIDFLENEKANLIVNTALGEAKSF